MNFIDHVATRIINEVRGINRLVYDVRAKPPGKIEWGQDALGARSRK